MSETHETARAPAALREKVTDALLTLTIREESGKLVDALAIMLTLLRLPVKFPNDSPCCSIADIVNRSCHWLSDAAFENACQLSELLALDGIQNTRNLNRIAETSWQRADALWQVLSAAADDPHNVDPQALSRTSRGMATWSKRLNDMARRRLVALTPAQAIGDSFAPSWQAVHEQECRLGDENEFRELLQQPYLLWDRHCLAAKSMHDVLLQLCHQFQALPPDLRDAIAAEADIRDPWELWESMANWGRAAGHIAHEAVRVPDRKRKGRPVDYLDHEICSFAHLAYELLTGGKMSKAGGSAFVTFLGTLLVTIAGPTTGTRDHARYLAAARLARAEKLAQAA